jgi:hypothetical protein
MSFGFDKLVFASPHGTAPGPFRGWHPGFIQKVLSPQLFPGVGVLETLCTTGTAAQAQADLTPALKRAWQQRVVVEKLRLTGESPHQGDTALACACASADTPLSGMRDEPRGSKQSGWVFQCPGHPRSMLGTISLGELARRIPKIIPYLGLPPGCTLSWAGGDDEPTIDTRKARRDPDDDLDD